MGRIGEVLAWFRACVHRPMVNSVSHSMRNIVVTLSTIYTRDISSVNYSLSYADGEGERAFFARHLPIRDWGRMGDIHNLNLNLHVPNEREIRCAIDFVVAQMRASMAFLNESLLSSSGSSGSNSSSGSDTSTTMTREERIRELAFLHHLMSGASRLLWRASTYAFVSEHIETSVENSEPDELDKGLGFERANVADTSHAYSRLSADELALLGGMRAELIEFVLTLSDKLLSAHANETTLLVTAAHILARASIMYGFHTGDFEKNWKTYHTNKRILQNKLLGKRNSTRDELIQRVMLQYQFRTFKIHTRMNALDARVIRTLFRLSVNIDVVAFFILFL